jgi:hypothetical protein
MTSWPLSSRSPRCYSRRRARTVAWDCAERFGWSAAARCARCDSSCQDARLPSPRCLPQQQPGVALRKARVIDESTERITLDLRVNRVNVYVEQDVVLRADAGFFFLCVRCHREAAKPKASIPALRVAATAHHAPPDRTAMMSDTPVADPMKEPSSIQNGGGWSWRRYLQLANLASIARSRCQTLTSSVPATGRSVSEGERHFLGVWSAGGVDGK